MLAEALCCERVLCLASIWVSYRGRRFKRSSLLRAGTSCASTHLGVSERVNVRLWSDVYVCLCGYLALWFCPQLCINMCVCVSSCRMYFATCVFAHSAAAPRVSITGLGPLPSRHNEHVVREARGTAAQIPTRAAGGESVPDQLYHCMELGPLKGKCHATINTIVVVTLRASVRIVMHMHVTHCELRDLAHKPGGWWCVFEFKAYSQTSPSTPSSLSVCCRPFSQQTF